MWPVWSTHPTAVVNAGGDAFANIWYLRWMAVAVIHGHNPFFSNDINYPFGVNVAGTVSEPLLGLLTVPVTVLWGPIASFNVIQTAGFALSGFSAYLLLRRVTCWRPAAFVGGLLFGFSPYMIATTEGQHIHLSFVALPPLMILCVHEIVVRQRGNPWRWGVLLGVLAAAQFFVSDEVLTTTAVVTLLGLVVLSVIGRKQLLERARRGVIGIATAATVAGALLAYPIWYALDGPGHISGSVQLVPQAYRADLLGPLVPDVYQWLAPASLARVAQHFAQGPVENGSYLGLTLLVVMAVGVVWLRRIRVVQVAAMTGVVAFVLSLGGGLAKRGAPSVTASGTATGLPLPEGLLAKLPLLSNVIPARYSMYVALCASTVLAVVLDRLYRRLSLVLHRGLAVGGAVALSAVALVPLVPSLPLADLIPARVPSYFTSGAVQRIPRNSVALLFPFPSTDIPNAVEWQAVSGLRFKMPGGNLLVAGADHKIAFTVPFGYTRATLTARTFIELNEGVLPTQTVALRRDLLSQIHSWRVDSVVAVPTDAASPARAMAFLEWLFGAPTTRSGDVVCWYGLLGHATSRTAPR